MPANDCVHWFSADSIDGVVHEPGLYAWYAIPVAGVPDWMVDHDENGLDRGAYNYGSFLANYTERLRGPDLSMSLSGPFWAEWEGKALERGYQVLASNIRVLAEGGSARGAKLRWALQNPLARERLAAVLEAASPRLSAPIYIGVSLDLGGRLAEHMETLEKASAFLSVGDEVPQNLVGTFGARAAMAGLTVDELRVAVLPVPAMAGMAAGELRNIAEAAEFVLNRWHKPIFGER